MEFNLVFLISLWDLQLTLKETNTVRVQSPAKYIPLHFSIRLNKANPTEIAGKQN